jgi:hypothetical protein
MQSNQPKSSEKPTYVKDLILLFSIPAAIALLVLAFLYIPRLSTHPKYDFIYAYCDYYQCDDSYSLSTDGHVTKSEPPKNSTYIPIGHTTKLGYYDVTTGASRMLDYSEAADINLINSSKSPDGYSLVRDTGDSGGFLFSGGYNPTWQLQNGLKKKTVTLNGDQVDYSNQITFIGWVQK